MVIGHTNANTRGHIPAALRGRSYWKTRSCSGKYKFLRQSRTNSRRKPALPIKFWKIKKRNAKRRGRGPRLYLLLLVRALIPVLGLNRILGLVPAALVYDRGPGPGRLAGIHPGRVDVDELEHRPLSWRARVPDLHRLLLRQRRAEEVLQWNLLKFEADEDREASAAELRGGNVLAKYSYVSSKFEVAHLYSSVSINTHFFFFFTTEHGGLRM